MSCLNLGLLMILETSSSPRLDFVTGGSRGWVGAGDLLLSGPGLDVVEVVDISEGFRESGAATGAGALETLSYPRGKTCDDCVASSFSSVDGFLVVSFSGLVSPSPLGPGPDVDKLRLDRSTGPPNP